MITISDKDRQWYQRAVQTFGAMTCPDCYGKIVKDKFTHSYYCEFCNAWFDAQTVGELFSLYNGFAKINATKSKTPMYIIYAEGTYLGSRALFKRRVGPALYCNEADADTFSYAQTQKIIQSLNGKYKWKAKKVMK